MWAQQKIRQLLNGPVAIRAEFYLPRPKRLMRRSDPAGPIAHTARPDIDNLSKSLLDAWRGMVWRDDAQIHVLLASKSYAEKDGIPRVEVEIDADELSA